MPDSRVTAAARWDALVALDPAPQISPAGEELWRVTLPGLREDALAGRRIVKTPPGSSGQQAIERAWARLVSLSEAGSLDRETGAAGGGSRRVRWRGTEWILE